MKHYFLITLISISISLQGQEIEISLKKGTDKESKGKEQLERIIGQYKDKIKKWFFTTKIEIDEMTIPFSHPILTLNSNYLENDLKQLSNFLHEEFHWLEESMPTQKDKAINDFKILFPEAPVGGNSGARDIYSTYLHLIVCDLELQAMTVVVGEKIARQILSEWTHYTWIYDKILHDKRIRQINTKNDFVIP
jgi:hypothetical protein